MNFLPDVLIPCEECHGKRYNRETLEVRFKGKSIADVLDMTVNQAVEFFSGHPLDTKRSRCYRRLASDISNSGSRRLHCPGGENQRVKLATELAKRDTGARSLSSTRPTTGLHFDDIRTLMTIIDRLVDRGNTVLVIEHNIDVVRMADRGSGYGTTAAWAGSRIIAEELPEKWPQLILPPLPSSARVVKG